MGKQGGAEDPAGTRDAGTERLLLALTTEHFVLQSARSGISSESTSRATLYLSALSASLVAFGFVVDRSTVFGYFAAAVVPVLAVLGGLTFVRLVEIGIEDLDHLAGIQRIRRYYAGLSPDARAFFPDLVLDKPVPAAAEEDEQDDTMRFQGLRPRRRQMWFTAASVIGVVNSMVVGSGAALAVQAAGASIPFAAVVAAAVAVALVSVHSGYQRRQYVAAARARRG